MTFPPRLRIAAGLLALTFLSACGPGEAPLAQGGSHASRSALRAAAANTEIRIEGKRADFTITKTANGVDIKDTVGSRGTVASNGATRVLFWDTSVALDTEGAAGQTYRLYQAAFARTPDVGGLSYWIGVMDAGASAETVASGFMASDEFKTAYGANVDNNTFVSKMYTNILGRAPEKAGLDYWVGALNGGFPRTQALALIADGAENKAAVASKIASGIAFTRSDVVYSLTGNNVLPVAVAGNALTAAANTTVTLSGSGSDAEGSKVTYRWSMKRPGGSIATLAGADTPTPSFKPDFTGDYTLSLVVNDGKADSAPSTVKVTATAGQFAERTVVIRVLSTDDKWGQEERPGWPNAAPIKDAPGYSLYDVEIQRNSSYTPVSLNTHKFTDWNIGKAYQTPETMAATKKAATLLSTPLSGTGTEGSTKLLAALKSMVDVIVAREQATRVVLEYSGHGSPTSFFEFALNTADARSFLAYLRSKTKGATLILDFSTNCDVGYFDFMRDYHDLADYLVASEKKYGGFMPDTVELLLKYQHDNNMHKFMQTGNSTQAAIQAMTASRVGMWDSSVKSITDGKWEESIVAYNLAEYGAYMKAVAAVPNFAPETDLKAYSNDLAAWTYGRNDANMTSLLESFRFSYTSDRHILTWSSKTLGYSVMDTQSLKSYLATMR